MKRLLLCLILAFFTSAACAHKPSDSYLALTVEGGAVVGQWDIALRDLDFAIGLDANGDAQITWGEVRAKHTDIDAYALSHLHLAVADKACLAQVTGNLIDDHTDGAYTVLRFRANCPNVVTALQVKYTLFFDIDPQHKGLLRLQYQNDVRTAVFNPESAAQQFILSRPGKFNQFLDYGREGVWHIWIGFDHILFLLALLLPAVAFRDEDVWRAVAGFRPAFLSVLKIVTAFTVAHSITLTLATLGIVSLPSRWVETTIAASVVVAALNNVFPVFREGRWVMAFSFGLIHGFGFASVLTDLGLPSDTLALALVGFNLGVETGQLVIVACFLPVAFLLRNTMFYRRFVLIGGSLAIIGLASLWLIERAFDMKLSPF